MNDTILNREAELPVGAKYGCLTVIARDDVLDDQGAGYLYTVQCKCGKFRHWPADMIREKKRKCGWNCGLKQQRELARIASYPRVESPSYNIEFVNNTHESLRIIECIDDHVEGSPIIQDKRKKDGGRVPLYKKFRCECYLCGQEYEFLSSDFAIRNDSFGSRASWGYYCEAYCNCHFISSFQWRTLAIFVEQKIAYKVEVSFSDLLSEEGNPLRYDFAILNPDGSIKCLIECQGRQHYEIGHGYGGYSSLERRQKRDALKREYAKKIGVPLIEIPYTYNTYDSEADFLRDVGVILK